MKDCVIVGVDVSKLTLDLHFKPSNGQMLIENKGAGFQKFYKQLMQERKADQEVLVVMEHTGKYSHQFELFLRSRSLGYCKLCALEIKRSIGLTRGKTDKVDAERIATYAWLRRETITADEYPCSNIERLKDLLSLRLKFVSEKNGFVCRLKEIKSAKQWNKSDMIVKMQEKHIALLFKNIKRLEKEITDLINKEKQLKQTFSLLISIKGVGLIVGAYMIACTDNFKRFANARKFNCYAGLAPFPYESGSSMRGKNRVSHLANKTAKWLLGLAAASAIQYDPEMKAYYQRRVASGKPKMSSQNAVRGKLIARMFAVVKRQTPYKLLCIAA